MLKLTLQRFSNNFEANALESLENRGDLFLLLVDQTNEGLRHRKY